MSSSQCVLCAECCGHTETLHCRAAGSMQDIPQIPTQDVPVATGMSEVRFGLVSASDDPSTAHRESDTACRLTRSQASVSWKLCGLLTKKHTVVFHTILCKTWRLLSMKILWDYQFLKHLNQPAWPNNHAKVKVTQITFSPCSDVWCEHKL